MNTDSKQINSEASYSLDLEFKGDRNYLHGTDIAQSLLTFTGPVENMTIQIHQVASHPLIAAYSSNSEISQLRSKKLLCAIMSFSDANKSRKLIALTEDFTRKITNRYQYDENQVTADASISDRQIYQPEPASGNFFERVVALNKFLLNNIIEKQPWLFSRIDLHHAPVVARRLSVEFKQEIGGHTFKSVINGDGVNLGHIFFTRRLK